MKFPLPPLYERLIYYILAPELFSRLFLEGVLGIYWYSITQPKQWIIYILIGIEYLFQFRSLLSARFVKAPQLWLCVLVYTMLFHGIIGGIIWGNPIIKVLTDSVPVFVLGTNIILLLRYDALENFNFSRVSMFIRVYCVVMVVVGTVNVMRGLPSVISLGGAGGGVLALVILLVTAFGSRSISLVDFAIFTLALGATLPNSTRTQLLVVSFVFVLYGVPRILKSGVVLYTAVIGAAVVIVSFPLLVPENSPLMRRLDAIQKLADSEGGGSTQGSIGDRQLEWEAINEKLRSLGKTAEWLGYGAGGTYDVVYSSGTMPPNYSHAHFSWALFRLRYGNIGFIYLALFALALLLTCKKTALSREIINRISFVLSLYGFVFLFTYFYYNFLICGLQFATRPVSARESLTATNRAQLADSGSRRD